MKQFCAHCTCNNCQLEMVLRYRKINDKVKRASEAAERAAARVEARARRRKLNLKDLYLSGFKLDKNFLAKKVFNEPVGGRAKICLHNAKMGEITWEEFLALRRGQLMRIRNFGEGTLSKLLDYIKEQNQQG